MFKVLIDARLSMYDCYRHFNVLLLKVFVRLTVTSVCMLDKLQLIACLTVTGDCMLVTCVCMVDCYR